MARRTSTGTSGDPQSAAEVIAAGIAAFQPDGTEGSYDQAADAALEHLAAWGYTIVATGPTAGDNDLAAALRAFLSDTVEPGPVAGQSAEAAAAHQAVVNLRAAAARHLAG